VSENHKDQAER